MITYTKLNLKFYTTIIICMKIDVDVDSVITNRGSTRNLRTL